MKTDIEIAQEAEMMPIKNVAEQLGITKMTLINTESIRQKFPMNTMKKSKIMKMKN